LDNEILEILKQIQKEQQETNKRLGNIETEIKDFKNQFTDFEGKSANNHVEVINRIDNMQKDLNTMELVTSKNWNDIAQLKAVK